MNLKAYRSYPVLPQLTSSAALSAGAPGGLLREGRSLCARGRRARCASRRVLLELQRRGSVVKNLVQMMTNESIPCMSTKNPVGYKWLQQPRLRMTAAGKLRIRTLGTALRHHIRVMAKFNIRHKLCAVRDCPWRRRRSWQTLSYSGGELLYRLPMNSTELMRKHADKDFGC